MSHEGPVGPGGVLDMHVHFWSTGRPPERLRSSEPGGVPDALDAPALLSAMDAARIDRAVQVIPSWLDGDDADSWRAASESGGRVIGVVSRIDPDGADVREQIRLAVRQPLSAGLRVTFVGPPPRSLPARESTLRRFWEAASDAGATVHVYAPEAAQAIGRVARAFPDLWLVVDHLAIATGVAPDDAHWADVLELAGCERVLLKASMLAQVRVPPRELSARLEALVAAFGADRICWGSNYPMVLDSMSYRHALKTAYDAFGFLSDTDREKVFHDTGAQLVAAHRGRVRG